MKTHLKALAVVAATVTAATAYLASVEAYAARAEAARVERSYTVDCGAFAVTFTGHDIASASDAGFAAVDYASVVRDVHGCGGVTEGSSPWIVEGLQ